MASKSKKLFDQAKKIIPSGVNSPVRFFKPYPFFVKKSQGSAIWDEDGKRYVDYCNGYGLKNLTGLFTPDGIIFLA